MSRAPYLHPSQRNLKTEQVGPSSHQNEYHTGVLQGNWVEDRAACGQYAVRCQLDRMTVNRASYKMLPESERQKVRMDAVDPRQVDRQLLFGHGTDFHNRDLASMSALMHSAGVHSHEPSLKSEATYRMTGATSSGDRVLLKKKDQWRDEKDADANHFRTSNTESHYKTAGQIILDPPPKAQCSRMSLITKDFPQAASLRSV
eukprot:Hpha_TRINITY_DN3526_c0_g1::TRINITY_DN3526_c0_g1_i1::g.25684::m.25684